MITRKLKFLYTLSSFYDTLVKDFIRMVWSNHPTDNHWCCFVVVEQQAAL